MFRKYFRTKWFGKKTMESCEISIYFAWRVTVGMAKLISNIKDCKFSYVKFENKNNYIRIRRRKVLQSPMTELTEELTQSQALFFSVEESS